MALENPKHLDHEDSDIQLSQALASLGGGDSLSANPNQSLQQQYWLNIAPPDKLTDFIVRQPNHTWNGLTIYPDEAWRYRNSNLWINWRGNQHEITRKLSQNPKPNPDDVID